MKWRCLQVSWLLSAFLAALVFFLAPGVRAGDDPEGLKERIEAWQESQRSSSEASYSQAYFLEEAYQDVFEQVYFPMVRLGSGWYPVRNLNLGLTVGGIYEKGEALGVITSESSGEDLILYVMPVQANLRYQFAFLQDQVVVPSIGAGADWWFFREDNQDAGDVEGLKTGYHLAADLGLLLDTLDPGAAHFLKRDLRIENTYLCLGYEYLFVGAGKSGFDFSGSVYSAGLRFEIGNWESSR